MSTLSIFKIYGRKVTEKLINGCILAFQSSLNPSFLSDLHPTEGGDATGGGWKRAVDLAGSNQDNMDVRVDTTKAALCFGTILRVALLAAAHISVLCAICGSQRSVTPP